MARKIGMVSLRIVSVLFTLWGVFIFIAVVSLEGISDHPALFYFLSFSYGFACILLGIISWKHADSFGSTLGAFLLLFVRIITFSFAGMCFFGLAGQIERSSAPGTSEMDVGVAIIEGVLILIFLGLTFWLTVVNKEKSEKRMRTIQTSGRYVIDPRDYRTDNVGIGCLVVFWLIWAPATAFFTYLAYTKREPFLFIWLFFGYLGTIGIPVAILFKNTKQIIEAAGNSLVVYGTMGYPWSKVRIQKQNLDSFTLERYYEHDQESVYTLNLFQKRGIRPHRVMLASFVHPKDKAILYEKIREFLLENGFEFKEKNEMS